MRFISLNYRQAFVGAVVAIVAGSFVFRFFESDDLRVFGAVAGGIGFVAASVVYLVWGEVFRSRVRGYGPRVTVRFDLRRNFWMLVKVVGAVYAVLVIFHSVTSGSLSVGFQMTASDIRVASKCPTEVGTVASFVTRSQGESRLLAFGSLLAFGTADDEIFEAICAEGWPGVLD